MSDRRTTHESHASEAAAKASGEHRAMAQAGIDGMPVTARSIAGDLALLGVRRGMLLNVHCAMSRLGWVVGGAQSVIAGLLEALGPTGTLAMPAHSGQLSEPANWRLPPAPEEWWETIRAEMPTFDPARTPSRAMGAVAENFRSYPGVLRSSHPQTSHAALGPLAETLVAGHPLDCLFGDLSPLGRLYELDGHVLLLGVDHGNNTVLHLAEDRAQFPGKARHTEGSPLIVDGQRRWQPFEPIDVSADDFGELGSAFARSGGETQGLVGAATARLMRVRAVVDFAVPWLESHRRA